MAKIKNIVRDNPLSNFRQVAPEGGMGFRLLAEGMKAAYERVAPAAAEEMKRRGTEDGMELGKGIVGSPTFDDTGYDFAPHLVEGGTRADAVSGMDRQFRAGLGAMLAAAPENIRASIKIGSGYRSSQRQAELWDEALKKYGSPEAARKWVAPPGRSQHNHGNAADLKYGSDEAKAWVHANAGKFGLNFPLGNEPWHIERSGARGGDHEPATVRTSDGNLVVRKYSPYSGPILQAHDAAAKVAYQSEILNKGTEDMMALSNDFILDPEGFAKAAEGYIDTIIEQAPAEMRTDLKAVLGKEAQRRRLGIMEDRQRDIRQRAANSSEALMKRWSVNYAEALASGDPYETIAAEKELDAILQAREALPGLAWTTEDSANVFIDAQRKADEAIAKQAKERSDGYKDTFNLIIEAAKAGRKASGEGLLGNSEAIALHPDLAREAQTFVNIREAAPDFNTMTPAQQAASLAGLTSKEVKADYELDAAKGVEEIIKENTKAWKDDPVKRAGEVLAQTEAGAPPALPDLSTATPDEITAALQSRRDYMNRVIASGYTPTRAYLSADESKEIAKLMTPATPVVARLAMMKAIAAGFGKDATYVFGQIGADPVTMTAGRRLAAGGREDVSLSIMMGQQMLDEGLVQAPPFNDFAEFSGTLVSAFDGVADMSGIKAEIMPTARAYYASQARGLDPNSDAAKALMEKSVQVAFGQDTHPVTQEVTGGVQSILGHQTLLPPGVSGKDVDTTLRAMLGASPGRTTKTRSAPVWGGVDAPAATVSPDEQRRLDIWQKAAGGPPMVNGKPIPREYLTGDNVRAVLLAPNLYYMQITPTGGNPITVQDGSNNMFVFDVRKLMEAAQ